MRRIVLTTLLAAAAAQALAQTPAPAPAAGADQVKTLDQVAVTVKSPPMWRLTRGGREIVVLGTQYPLPQTMPFFPRRIEEQVARAQAVIWPPGVRADDSVSLLRGMMLWNSVRKAKQNEGGAPLSAVLPANTYAQFQAAKARYLPGNTKIESMRPMYAAYELYEAALRSVGVRPDDPVYQVVSKTAKASKIPMIDARVAIPVAASKSTARAFSVPVKADLACLQSTLDRLDPFVGAMSSAANAWSVGDMGAYRAAIARYEPLQTCWARLTNEALAGMSGVVDPYGRTEAHWMETLRSTVAAKERVFVLVPARDMVNGTGVARLLAADGWVSTPLFKEAD